MKIPFQVVVAIVSLFQLQSAIEATVIYQNDFSETQNPFTEVFGIKSGDLANQLNWSAFGSLQTDSGNQYAQYKITVASVPSDPNARWYGGFYGYVSSATSLPAEWQLSFDVLLSDAQPVRVSFGFVQGHFPPQTTSDIYWVQPAGVGWQHVVIDQNTPFSVSQDNSGASQPETFLTVALSSHDASGNPLPISQVGTYTLSLDNILLQSVPEPGVSNLAVLAGALFFGLRRLRNTGRKLGTI